MIIKGRSPHQRHVSRTHRVDLDCLCERSNSDATILTRYVNSKEQIADTKCSFTFLGEVT